MQVLRVFVNVCKLYMVVGKLFFLWYFRYVQKENKKEVTRCLTDLEI